MAFIDLSGQEPDHASDGHARSREIGAEFGDAEFPQPMSLLAIA